MGDLISIAFLLAFVAVVLYEHWSEAAEERADRRSRRMWDAFRDEMERQP